jgi:cobalt-zinc-cadmium efflux system protein
VSARGYFFRSRPCWTDYPCHVDHGSAAGQNWRPLAAALGVSVAIVAGEVIAGIAGNSLALLADAGHVFADVAGMGLSLAAIAIASRPRTTARTFGLYRLEILAAAMNAVVLLGIGVVILIEAVRRFSDPLQVHSGLVAVVAALVIAANLVSLRVLGKSHRASLTMRAAYLEVVADILGAGAVLIAAIVIAVTGWYQADAVASLGIAVLIIPRTLGLLRDTVDVLLEATPKGIDMAEVERHILEAPGVREVHDLHAWTITSGMNVISAHVVLSADGVPGDVLDHLGRCLADDFDIDHSTFQLETPEHVRWEADSSMPQH